MYSWNPETSSPQPTCSILFCAALATRGVSRPWLRLDFLKYPCQPTRKCFTRLVRTLWAFQMAIPEMIWASVIVKFNLCSSEVIWLQWSCGHWCWGYRCVHPGSCHLPWSPWHFMHQEKGKYAFLQRYVCWWRRCQVPNPIPCHDWLWSLQLFLWQEIQEWKYGEEQLSPSPPLKVWGKPTPKELYIIHYVYGDQQSSLVDMAFTAKWIKQKKNPCCYCPLMTTTWSTTQYALTSWPTYSAILSWDNIHPLLTMARN